MKSIAMPRDAWIGVVFLVLAVVYWIAADGIRISPLDGPVTAAGLPKSLGYPLGGLSVLLILRSLALRRSAVGRPASPEPAADPAEEDDTSALLRPLRTIVLLAFRICYLPVMTYPRYLLPIISLILVSAPYTRARFR